MRKNALLMATALAAVALAPNVASATVITFETPSTPDFSTNVGPYAGLTFTNFATINGPGYSSLYGGSGYANDVVSGTQVACGCAGDIGQTISSITSLSAFSLNSGYFASAWNDGATLLVQGFLGVNQLYSSSFVLDTLGPQFLTFNFGGIDRAEFSISGGTENLDFGGGGDYFAVDNLDIGSSAVPEPATWAMMILGFGLIGSMMRRKQQQTVRFSFS